MADNKKKIVLWRSRFGKQATLTDSTKYVNYYEDVAFRAASYAVPGFYLAVGATWMINISAFPRPPSSDFVGHMGYWLATLGFHISHHHLLARPALIYNSYLNWLDDRNLGYIINTRIFAGKLGAIAAGIWGAKHAIQSPKSVAVEVHTRGAKKYVGEEAERMLAPLLQKEIARSGKFAQISDNLYYSEERRTRHTILIGASGTGKSQWLGSQVIASIEQKLKTFMLDPKYEFTAALYKDDGTMAIIDPTDLRSHVWDIGYDLKKLGLVKKLAAGMIPQTGDNAMWSNAARAVFVGLVTFLRKVYGEKWGWKDLSDLIPTSLEERAFIMDNYYRDAFDFVGKKDPDTGDIETNVTHEGINTNFKAFMDGIRDMARFWYDDEQPKFSLFEFMTNPDYPIKTVFVKPNAVEQSMGEMLMAAMTSYAIGLIDSPFIQDSKIPVGNFFLDEFHAAGKLMTEGSNPTPVINKLIERGRSKAWGGVLSCQNTVQLYQIYSRENVQAWRETCSSFILTGAPIGETSRELADAIGEQFIDKLHLSVTNQADGSSSSTNYQEHNKKVLLPSEIAAELNPDDTHIKYLAIFRGIEDIYILSKPYIDIKPKCPAWIEQIEMESADSLDSRVVKLVRDLMKKSKDKESALKKVATSATDTTKSGTTTGGGKPRWVPTEKQAHAGIQEEASLIEDEVDMQWVDDALDPELFDQSDALESVVNNLERAQMYEMPKPEEGELTELEEVAVHMGMEAGFHSPALSTAKEMIDVLAEGSKVMTQDKKKMLKAKNEAMAKELSLSLTKK